MRSDKSLGVNIPQQERGHKVLDYASNLFDHLANDSNGLVTRAVQLHQEVDRLVEDTRSNHKGRLDNSLDLLLTIVDNARNNDKRRFSQVNRLLNNARNNPNRRLYDSLNELPNPVDNLNHLGDADSKGVVAIISVEVEVEVGFNRLEATHGMLDGRADDGDDDGVDEGDSDADDRFG